MASPSTVISLGYGSWGSVNDVITLGYGMGEGAAVIINMDADVYIDRAFAASVIRDRTFTSSSYIDRAYSKEVELIDE